MNRSDREKAVAIVREAVRLGGQVSPLELEVEGHDWWRADKCCDRGWLWRFNPGLLSPALYEVTPAGRREAERRR